MIVSETIFRLDMGFYPSIYIYMYTYIHTHGEYPHEGPFVGSMSSGLARNIDRSAYDPRIRSEELWKIFAALVLSQSRSQKGGTVLPPQTLKLENHHKPSHHHIPTARKVRHSNIKCGSDPRSPMMDSQTLAAEALPAALQL